MIRHARRYRTKQQARTIRIDQTNYGLGVFAARRFRPGQSVGEVTGRVIHDSTYDSAYCIDVGGLFTLEPDPPFRLVNHSCEPNCQLVWMERRRPTGAPALVYVESLRAIAEGEQLTIDYAWPAEVAIPCACGSFNCRGWIVAEEELSAVASRGLEVGAKLGVGG